ncbi:cytochrome ubiquinol oxidase subunit I [Roseateles depolymerans]|uniref:Cytochrome D ubiquinol oxidase subunit n=1 Tax=Roseateles depolymerans TaxID=76731 RepID=A0A0U3CGC3_9BURK|nr:cytochrome ubiquinol oxidase subunit I [Roseateles depolymerans]ALV07736.1 Cytochrome D ubiquinol oxidase subunit [Roseateles depolymerans]REG22040.1 cytochrome bd-I ubiquinol oxidase subunit 1 apoprotein [Roseateles depolymerans]
MDPLILARMQFALNITFHILFPTITIALGWVLLFMLWRWRRTAEPRWMAAYQFWTKVFALSFALGVVSGVTMSFQFGTNWPGFMERAGNIAGPLLGYEVLTAFFLEAGFLGIMLFGRNRVSPRVHLAATAIVAFGTTLSAFWILSLNSWMQTPAGYEMRDGVMHATNWWAIVFNPSFPYRLVHKLLASGLTVAFLLSGVSAWQLLKGVQRPETRSVLRLGLTLASVLIPLQILAGDMHGLNTLQHQPAKIAAMEGVWQTERGAPLLLFAVPDAQARENRFEIGIPRLASLILTHDIDGEIRGLNEFQGAHPPVKPLFYGFRVMVGAGMLMLVAAWAGLWALRRSGWQSLPRPWLWVLSGMSFSGWVATVAGWYVTEIGRQPYVVYGVLRTDTLASTTPSSWIAASLAGYATVYLALLVAYVVAIKRMAEKSETPETADKTELIGPGALPAPAAPLNFSRTFV